MSAKKLPDGLHEDDVMEPRHVTLQIRVTLVPGASPNQVIEGLVDFLATDPDDLFPLIDTVDGWDVEDD